MNDGPLLTMDQVKFSLGLAPMTPSLLRPTTQTDSDQVPQDHSINSEGRSDTFDPTMEPVLDLPQTVSDNGPEGNINRASSHTADDTQASACSSSVSPLVGSQPLGSQPLDSQSRDHPPELDIPTANTLAAEATASSKDIIPMAEIERLTIERAIDLCEGNVVKAAKALEVSPSTLYRKMQNWEGNIAG